MPLVIMQTGRIISGEGIVVYVQWYVNGSNIQLTILTLYIF